MSVFSSVCLWVGSAALIVLSVGGCGDGQVNAQEPMSPAEQKALTLVDATGLRDIGKQMYDQVMTQVRETPGVEQEKIDMLVEVFDFESMVNNVAKVYAKHLDEPTLEAVITFAKSPAGQEWFAKQAIIQNDLVQTNQQWVQELQSKLPK